jgi:hypothetical protein
MVRFEQTDVLNVPRRPRDRIETLFAAVHKSAFDRDLIRGGHYGQRPCVPHLKAEHMAAPTKTAYVKKALANSEPSTHGT